MSVFCAICTSARGPFVRRPLGRNDAMVAVCTECDDVPAREKRGPDAVYEVAERVISGQTATAFRRAANRVMGATADANRSRRQGASFAAALQPGFILVKVRRRIGLDAREARTTLKNEPWYAEVRHLGSDRRWHLFERPDVDAAREARSGNDRDPLAAIREHAAKNGAR